MKTELASELEKEHKIGGRGLRAGPALPSLIFEILVDKLLTLGFIY